MRALIWGVTAAALLGPVAASAERWVTVGTPEAEEEFAWEIDADRITRDGARRGYFIRIKNSTHHHERTVDCEKRLMVYPASTAPIDQTNEIYRAAFDYVCLR